MATQSSILAWKIPWTEDPGRLQSVECKEPDTTEHACTYYRISQYMIHLICLYVLIQSLSHVRLFATPWIAACQASLSFNISLSFLKLMSSESVMSSIISSSVIPFSSCTQSCPASGSFPMSQPFASGGKSIGASASASVLPINI